MKLSKKPESAYFKLKALVRLVNRLFLSFLFQVFLLLLPMKGASIFAFTFVIWLEVRGAFIE